MKIVSNIKGGVDCEISTKTLILGASGSGKSAIVNSIELAVSRRIGDLLAREDVSRKDLLACYTQDGAPPQSTVEPLDPSTTLPFRDLKEALRGSPETFWRYVLRRPADEATKRQLKYAKDRLAEATSALEYLGRLSAASEFLHSVSVDIARRRDQCRELESALESDTQSIITPAEKFAVTWARNAQKFVPDALGSVKLSATKDGKLDFKLGLMCSSGPQRLALSGAEFNIVLTALAIALNDSPTSFVIPDDRAISSLTLSSWLEKLAQSKCQILITSVAKPKAVPPKAFTVVSLVK